MPFYMSEVSYTSEAWAAQIANPQDRSAVVAQMMAGKGGRMVSFYYAFGEYDIVLISEAPDNTTIASALIAATGAGAISKLRTTVLMTAEEGLAAIRGAGDVTYTPPG